MADFLREFGITPSHARTIYIVAQTIIDLAALIVAAGAVIVITYTLVWWARNKLTKVSRVPALVVRKRE